MAVHVEVPFKNEVNVTRSPSDVLAFLKKFDSNIPSHFPGIDALQPTSGNSYDWIFQKIEYGGYSLTPKLLTHFEIKDSQINIVPENKPGYSQLAGYWRVLPEGTGSKIEFSIKLSMELPIPSLLKSMAAPVVQKELTKLFQRYLDNVGKTLSQ